MARIVVAGVGNLLRGDDGFGPAVAEALAGTLPPDVDLVETGIGGLALVHELMDGCAGLVIVDAVDRGAAPGTLFEIEPEVGDAVHVPDVHLANPERVLNMAKGLGILPRRLAIVGCQPAEMEEVGEGLSPAVARAVPLAARMVTEVVTAWRAAEPA